MAMTEDERLALWVGLGVPKRVFCNVVPVADLPAAMLARHEAEFGTQPAAARSLSNVLRAGDLQFSVVFLGDLSTDQLAHLALMAEAVVARDEGLIVVCRTDEVAATLDTGPWINVANVIVPPTINGYTDTPRPETDQLFAEAALANIERMLRRDNPTLAADAAAELAINLVTSPDFFRRTDPT